MRVHEFPDGIAIQGDCTSLEVYEKIKEYTGGSVRLIVTDPPYGNILSDEWDKTTLTDNEFASWMIGWTNQYQALLAPGAAFYVWGGIGVPGFRPFLNYLYRVESETSMSLANLVTWSKKRAYGVQHNYLFTREELAYLCNGDPKRPLTFNVPLLEEKRGYSGFNAKYPAKSEYKRRTNVWCDVTELFRGKVHSAQKPSRVYEIPIEVHTAPGDVVVDVFAGSGACAHAARKLQRRFVLVEKHPETWESLVQRLQ